MGKLVYCEIPLKPIGWLFGQYGISLHWTTTLCHARFFTVLVALPLWTRKAPPSLTPQLNKGNMWGGGSRVHHFRQPNHIDV